MLKVEAVKEIIEACKTILYFLTHIPEKLSLVDIFKQLFDILGEV